MRKMFHNKMYCNNNLYYFFISRIDKEKVVIENLNHNDHNKDNIKLLNRQKINNKLKRVTKDNIFERPSKLILKESIIYCYKSKLLVGVIEDQEIF